jgi:hypothetical protein
LRPIGEFDHGSSMRNKSLPRSMAWIRSFGHAGGRRAANPAGDRGLADAGNARVGHDFDKHRRDRACRRLTEPFFVMLRAN